MAEHGVRVSVVVPVFNRLELLEATVESLRSQTMAAAEFIIVDDGSEEPVRNFLASLSSSDKRFRCVAKKAHEHGRQTSRNAGLDAARGEGIVFLDSDDLLAPHCLERWYCQLTSQHGVDIIVGRQAVLSPNGVTHWVNVEKPGPHALDRVLAFSHPIDVPWLNGGAMLSLSRLRERGVRWQPFHWDDVAFHFECLVSGMSVRWTEEQEDPDSFYRQHDEERCGSILATDEGITSTAAMIGWMLSKLKKAGRFTDARHERLAFNFYRECILPLIDRQNYSLASTLISNAVKDGVLGLEPAAGIKRYLAGRRAAHASDRVTFYWNRLADRTLLEKFQVSGESTYRTVPVPHESPAPAVATIS